MADETVKKLLIKLGISTSDWKTAVNDIKSQLNSVNEQAKKDAAQMKATQKEQLDLTRQQIAEQQRLTAEARTLEAVDRAKATWQKQQQAAIQTAVTQRKLETAEAQKQNVIKSAAVKMAQEQLRLEQMRFTLFQRQQSLIQKQAKEQGAQSGGGGILGGLGRFASSLAGGGLIGSIAGGVLAGGLISEGPLKLLDAAGEKIHSLAEALVDAAGPAVQLREQFEKLSARAGIAPDEYLSKLRTATRGLADDVSLYRIANNYMQQGLHVTNDEIIRLVSATVNLARAQGKQAPEAMGALERASKTGRAQVLAMVTGLTRQELSLRGVSQALDATTRNTMQFNQVLAALEAREKAIGTPATTLPELLKQWQIVQKNLIDDTAVSISKTIGFQNAIQSLANAITSVQPILSKFAELVGHDIGDSLYLIGPLIKLFTSSLKLGETIVNSWDRLSSSITGTKKAMDDLGTGATGFHKFITQMAYGFTTISQYVTEASIKITAFGNVASAVLRGNAEEAARVYKQMNKDIADSRDNYGKDVIDILSFGAGTGDSEVKPAGKQHDIDPNIQGAKQRQQLQLQIAKETADIEYEITQQRLKKQEDDIKLAYDKGLVSLEQEVSKERELYAAEHAAKLKEINAERDAKIKNIQQTAREQGTPRDIVQGQVKVATLGAQQKTEAENIAYQQKGAGLDTKLAADKEAAARETANELTRIAKEGIQDRLSALESEFKEGLVPAVDYLAQRKQLIQDELKAVQDGLKLQLQAAKDNEAEKAKINAQAREAERLAQRQASQLDLQRPEILFQGQLQQYQQQIKPIQTQVQTARQAPIQDVGALTEQRQGTAQLEMLAVQQIVELNKQMNDPNLVAGSKTWNNIREQIALATQELQKYHQEMQNMNNVPNKLAPIFGSVSQLAGSIPRSRTAEGISQLFGSMQQSSADIGKFTNASDNAGGGEDLFKNLQQSFTALFSSAGSAADKLQAFGQNLENIISGVMGVVKGVTSGKTGGEGALSGGMAGAQFGAAFGPWGELAGGVGGAVMGGIFGSKEKQLTQDIHKVTTQLQSIISDLQAGTISLSQAIQDLRNERQQAIQLLSQDPKGGKGGGKGGKKGYTPSQAQAVIQQIDAQIQTLVNQQTQTLESLSTSLMEISNPQQYQEYLQTLQQIIQQYQTFASAAQGNAQEMTAANQYLNDSLNQYVVTLSQNLNQAQQTAINDALTLINLEYQRQQMINQEAQSQYDVLTQGVLTRQRTTAMTKGQEIGQIQYQAQMQMEQINEQISLQQYKVQTETQIFNLATTRIGLENQLLSAQEEQANYQILQVQALASVVASLTSGLSGGALMSQITQEMASGAMPTEAGIMYALLEMLGLSGNVPPTAIGGQYGTTNWLAGIPATDASAAQYVASLDPNFPNLILSDQFAAAAADAQQYASQGEVEGYDMNDLIAWLQQQPGAAEGGDVTGPVVVGENGPEILSPGIKGTVLSNPIVTALNAMTGGIPQPQSTGTSSASLDVHNTLLDLTSQRTSMEMTVITARQSQIQSEMALLSAYQDTFSSIANGNSPTSGLEDMMQKVWENRGRYGNANFRRQNI